jgi:hypothetical protein
MAFAGVKADCVTVLVSEGETATYCVTVVAGILAYIHVPTKTIQMTSYSTNVPDSEFALPGRVTTSSTP